MVARIYSTCLSQLTVFEKNIGPIILPTLTVHHVPNSMSCNGISRVIVSYYMPVDAYQYASF